MSEEIKSLVEFWQRIQRILNSIEVKSGQSFNESYLLSGISTSLKVNGIKSPKQLEDELLNIFVCLWSIKDYFKAAYNKAGLSDKLIEELVNKETSLQVVADIANSFKHGSYKLKPSRSKRNTTLTKVGIEIPQSAISQIIAEASKITLNVNFTQHVILTARIADGSGEDICDAFDVIRHAMKIWEVEAEKINMLLQS